MSVTAWPVPHEAISVSRSSAVKRRPRTWRWMLCRTLRCVCITPLGVPVEPDV
jgi:hypothetical protein